jgi:hypothetical protein
MHRGQRPRNLRDISHLYLSSSHVPGEAEAGPSALVVIASLEGCPLRAWLSSGLAAAFGSQNASVTLLETISGLPCAGYYFALRPDRYLRPVIEPGAVVEANTGGKVGVLCARDPALLRQPGIGYAAGPRILLFAFDWPGSTGNAGLRVLLDSVPALKESGGWEGLPAFLLTLSDRYPGATEEILREFDSLFPEGSALALFPGREVPGGEDTEEMRGIEPCPFPVEMLEGLSRRKPPASAFLSGLAGEIFQRLGSRKRGAAGDGS